MNKVIRSLQVASMLGLTLGLSACHSGSGGGSQVPPGTTQPPSADPQIALQRVFSQFSFNAPVAMVQAPGDSSRWFVVEKQGVVKVFDNDPIAEYGHTDGSSVTDGYVYRGSKSNDGELYLLDFSLGEIYEIVDTP